MHTVFVDRTNNGFSERAAPRSTSYRNMPCENEDMLHADENMLISDPQVVPSPHVLPGHNRLRKCQTQQISLLLPGPTMIVSLTRDAENLVQHDLIALDALLELQARARPKPRLTNLQTRGRPTIRFGWQQGRFTSCGSEFTYVQELTCPSPHQEHVTHATLQPSNTRASVCPVTRAFL